MPKKSSSEDYEARRSSRVAAGAYAADNDTWIEALAVCEVPAKPGYGDKQSNDGASKNKKGGGGGLLRKFKSKNSFNDANSDDDERHGDADVAAASQRLTLRPYFQSRNTGERVWDEPPSGASNIVYATPEARKMAQAQLEEMRSTYAHAAVQRRQEREEKKALKAAIKQSEGGEDGKGKKSVLPKMFKRKSNASATEESQRSLLNGDTPSTRVRGTLVLQDEGGRSGIPKSILQESKELAGVKSSTRYSRKLYEADLQRAMAMSMELGGGSVMGVGDNKPRSLSAASTATATSSSEVDRYSGGMTREEEEELAMAIALSQSEHEVNRGSGMSSSSGKDKGDREEHGISPSNGYLPTHISSSNSSKENNFASASANTTKTKHNKDFAMDFDGGGKMPARPKIETYSRQVSSKKGKSNKSKSNNKSKSDSNNDFGDRGASWELDWNRSPSPQKKKDPPAGVLS